MQKGFIISVVPLIVVVLILAVGGVFYFNKSNISKVVPPTPSAKITLSPSSTPDETANWKTYKNENITFKFPPNWSEKPEIVNGNRFAKEFKDPEANFAFSFSSDRNYNQSTGKPYSTIDEFVDMPYKVKTVVVDGQDGRQPLPRAGSENVILVDFFSKDSKTIYILDLKVGDTSLNTPEADVEKGQKLFDQILSTFKFLPASPTGGDQKSAEGKICGGFGGEKGQFACPAGYKCKYPEPMYPDAQGQCVRSE